MTENNYVTLNNYWIKFKLESQNKNNFKNFSKINYKRKIMDWIIILMKI